MTLKNAIEYGKATLEQANIKEASLDAWYLLEFVTQVSRATYFGNPEKEMDANQITYYQEVIEKRSQRIPLQHITGVQEFMGYLFQVNEHVLIPRQDTETLIETALEYIPKDFKVKGCDNTEGKYKVLDMCTGSGCIVISLLKLRDTICGSGVDVSSEALEVARNNGILNEVEVQWMESDLFTNIDESYDLIISNPPYIQTSVIGELEAEVKLHDPMLALDGKADGLYFYRKIIEQAREYLNPAGVLLFEIGHDQGEAVSEYMKAYGFEDVIVKKDLAGLDRVVCGHVQ